jgi:uncharacterized membrane protein YbhN (UPF0104 family)
MLKGSQHWIAFASSLLFLAAIFFILGREQSVGVLAEVWNRADPAALTLATLLILFVQAVGAWRVKVIATADGLTSIKFISLFRIQLISQFVAHGAPISALSDIAKAAMLKLRFNLSVAHAIRLVLYERACGALAAVVVGLAATFVQLALRMPQELVLAQFLLWGGGCAGMAVFFAIGGVTVNTGINLLDRAVGAVIGLGNLLRRSWVVSQLLLVSTVQLVSFALVFIVLAHGMHLPASPLHIFLFMPLIFFVSSLPVFYLGWGGREAVVIATLGTLGNMTKVEAVALSVAFGVAVFLASLPGAVFWAMRPSMRKAIQSEFRKA